MEKQIDKEIQEIIDGVDKHMLFFPMTNEEREQALVRDGIFKGKKGMIKIEEVEKIIEELIKKGQKEKRTIHIGEVRQELTKLKEKK
jgi:hypothetical protein